MGTEGTTTQKARVFEMLLSSPGMGEKTKMDVRLSRQNILLFCHLLETGLGAAQANGADDMMTALPEGSLEEVRTVMEDMLQKSGLTGFYEKLKAL